MKRSMSGFPVILAATVFAVWSACGKEESPTSNPPLPERGHVDVLFIGNSLSMYGDAPGKLQMLLDSIGADIAITDVSMFGTPLSGHLIRTMTLDSIRAGKWEMMILQEADYTIAFPDYHSYLDSIYYALRDTIFTHNRGCELVYFMDYSMKNGVSMGGTDYTFAEFTAMIRDGTLIMADRMDFMVAPIGVCFNTVHADRPDIELFHHDEAHPSNVGSYLQACVYFSVLMRQSSVGLPRCVELDSIDAAYLQQVASTAVLDSLRQWNIPQL
jgi:hypothetical protein